MAKVTELSIYELIKDWFDFCFENPDIINPNHGAMYFFILEHNNRLGWKQKFGLPMQMTMDAIGIRNNRTYSKAFNDLVDWGFIVVHQKSKNQYSANVIAIVKNTRATTKALSKATHKHSQKQRTGIAHIDIPITNIPITNLQEREKEISPTKNYDFFIPTSEIENYMNSETQVMWFESFCMNNHITSEELKIKISEFVKDLQDKNIQEKDKKDLFIHFANYYNNAKRINSASGRTNKTTGAETPKYGLKTKREIKSAI